MKDTSILIPTRQRPHFLSKVLESVARQTAVARIGEVLVMENGLDRRSETVCRQFPQLPIKYIYRDPVVPVSKLAIAVLDEATLPFVAMLHDDDWWLDFHLERSLKSLAQHPHLSATYSSHFNTGHENLWLQGSGGSFTAWFGNDQRISPDERVLNYRQMLVTSIMQSGFHMSSLVFRRSIMAACYPGLNDGNEFDVDRTLSVELARQGDVLFHETPSLVVRHHADQDNVRAVKDKRYLWFQQNTLRLLKEAQTAGLDLHAELTSRTNRPGFGPQQAMQYILLRDLSHLAANAALPAAWLPAYRRACRRNEFSQLFARIKRWF